MPSRLRADQREPQPIRRSPFELSCSVGYKKGRSWNDTVRRPFLADLSLPESGPSTTATDPQRSLALARIRRKHFQEAAEAIGNAAVSHNPILRQVAKQHFA